MKNHYNTLGVSRDATLYEIKAAYKKLALRFHPDRTRGNKAAEEFFKEVNEAYYVLRDSFRRSRYDLLLDFKQNPPLQQTIYTPYQYQSPFYHTRRHRPTSSSGYRFDRTYYKHQFLALLVVGIIASMVIATTEFNRYLKEQEREETRALHQKILSSAQMKFNTGDFYGALQMVKGLASKHPIDFDMDSERDKMTERLFEKAEKQFAQKDYQNAIYNLLIVKEFQHPQKLKTFEYLAQSYIALKDFEKGAATLEYILLRDPHNLDLTLQIARLYHIEIKNLNKAMVFYDKAKSIFKERQKQLYGKAFELLMDPTSTPEVYYEVFINRARANIESGDFETAVTDCNWASFLRPLKSESYYLRALSYHRLNRSGQACKDYARALENGFDETIPVSFCQ